MTDDKKKMAAKIQALIAKAQSSEHEEEADAFMQKAQQLLEHHQIDLGDLLDADDPVIVQTEGFEQTSSSPSWYKDLYIAVGGLYGCKAVIDPKLLRTARGNMRIGYGIELIGRQSAVITTQLMFPWIKSQCFEKARKIWRDHYGESSSNGEKKLARKIGNALVQRIWALVNEQEKKDPATKAKNALITVDRVLQVYDEYTADPEQFKDSTWRPTITNTVAREAANSIGLHRQTGSSSPLALGKE